MTTRLPSGWISLLSFFLLLSVSSISSVAGQDAAPPIIVEWTQDAHDAQRSNYTYEQPLEPWTLLWTWNGPDENGGLGGHFYDAQPEARTVTGGLAVYVPAGDEGLYALAKTDGQPIWHVTETSFKAAPAYDPATGNLLAGGSDGLLYRIDTVSGTVTGTYNATSPIEKAILLVGNFVYVVTQSGHLHKVDSSTMTARWVYEGSATAATPASYSFSRGVIVFATNDLFVHTVNDVDGKKLWSVKPTPNPAGFPNEFEGQYPVIAEQHGLVFVRMRLDHDAGLWGGPGPGGMYPENNAETRAYLMENPNLQNLFALNLDTGEKAFIPAVGYSGHEGYVDGIPFLDTGPLPVIRALPDGTEVAYLAFRSGQGVTTDGRWDSHLGEMVLDDSTIEELEAGDLRFIEFADSDIYLTDEAQAMTLAGDTVFTTNWSAVFSTTITDRSPALGLTVEQPIQSRTHPTIVRSQNACNSFNVETHWTACTLSLFGDTRVWRGPGWWVYWNVQAPYNPPDGYTGGILPRYTYVSDGLIISQGEAGELFVLKHSGNQ